MTYRRVLALVGLVVALAAPASAALAAPQSVMLHEGHNGPCGNASSTAQCAPHCSSAYGSGHDGASHTWCTTADHGPSKPKFHYRGVSRFVATVNSFDGTSLTMLTDLGLTVTLKLSSRTHIGGVDGAPNTLAPGEDVLVSYYAYTPGVVVVVSVEILPQQDSSPSQGNGGGIEPGQPTAAPTEAHASYSSLEATVLSFDGTTLNVQADGAVFSITMVTPTSHVSLGHQPGAPATPATGERVRVYRRNGVTVGVLILGADVESTATPQSTAPSPVYSTFDATVLSFDGTTLVVQAASGNVSINMSTSATPPVHVEYRSGGPNSLAPGEHVSVYLRNGVTVAVVIVDAGTDGTATAQATQPEPTSPPAQPTQSGTSTSFSATVVSFDGTTLVVQGTDNTISITMSPSVSVGGSTSNLVPGAHVTIYERLYSDGSHTVVGVVVQQ